jgi:hypothetical protein
MTKLKVGDRVRAYRSFKSYVGKIIGVENGLVTLMCDEDKNGRSFHPKQCRRLKVRSTPKAKKVPMEVWLIERQKFKPIISEGLYGSIIQDWSVVPKGFQGAVLFREVLK